MELWITAEEFKLEFPNDFFPLLDPDGPDDGPVDDASIESEIKTQQRKILAALRKAGIEILEGEQPSEAVKYDVRDSLLNMTRYGVAGKVGSYSPTDYITSNYKEALDYMNEIKAGKALISDVPKRVGLINRKLQRG